MLLLKPEPDGRTGVRVLDRPCATGRENPNTAARCGYYPNRSAGDFAPDGGLDFGEMGIRLKVCPSGACNLWHHRLFVLSQKKNRRGRTPSRRSTTSAYLLTSPRAQPSCSSSSRPTTSIQVSSEPRLGAQWPHLILHHFGAGREMQARISPFSREFSRPSLK